MNFIAIIFGLLDAGVEFVVVGMVAGLLYGSRSTTQDIDMVYRDEPANVARLASYLQSIEAYVMELWPNEGVASEFSIDRLSTEKSLALGTREGEIDVLHRIDGIGQFDDVLAMSQEVSLEGRAVRVITLAGLIQSKRASNRPKDLLHIAELECMKELRRDPSEGV